MKNFRTINGIQKYLRSLNIPKDDIPYQFKFKGIVFTQLEYDEPGNIIIYQAEKEFENGDQFIDVATSNRYSATGLKDAIIDIY